MNYGDKEDDELGYSDLDDYAEGLEHWRWCEHLSVLEAAMLVVNIDPSKYEPAYLPRIEEGQFHRIGTSNHVKNYFYSVEFVPVFRAISYAVIRGELPCDFSHLARTVPYYEFGDRTVAVPANDFEGEISFDVLIRADKKVKANFEVSSFSDANKFYFIKEPDWTRSKVNVSDFRDWMKALGRKPKFFFPDALEDSDLIRDPSHEHFSAELDFAISAWHALLQKRKFPTGVKAAIEKWIEDNPDVWRGKEPLSNEAKRRVTTLINWNKSGGAPKTGG
ncbi:hypothetical protein [Roseibaca sp. Y0-43]|uniref:hypothetical protein n=1 Tax=Roseibaca sp. Y0-43 TaxID=2816854 RepID=UPI001D0C9923|nr:hypothetical protein [Roseibaca sp. Y0-43]MCC1481062.1 hypothetical protein [Roseibaca sp. Y0-43]